jgi:hypothetical protein
MSSFILRCCATEKSGPCGVCGEVCDAPSGNQLVLAATDEPVCTTCGRKHAPDLAALVSLASTAVRIGRMERNSVFPPLTALLALASAAERYSTAARLRMTA